MLEIQTSLAMYKQMKSQCCSVCVNSKIEIHGYFKFSFSIDVNFQKKLKFLENYQIFFSKSKTNRTAIFNKILPIEIYVIYIT